MGLQIVMADSVSKFNKQALCAHTIAQETLAFAQNSIADHRLGCRLQVCKAPFQGRYLSLDTYSLSDILAHPNK